MPARRRFAALACALLATPAAGDIFLTEGTNISVDTSADGRHAIDILGALWVVPAGGGEALALDSGEHPARRPRWSPDDRNLVYESRPPGRSEIHLFAVDDQASAALSKNSSFDQQPAWHPDGERVVFASARHDTGSDIWEVDVPTRLEWRLTQRIGNETEPAWSPDGRDLLYIHEYDGLWQLVLRRRGAPEEILAASDRRLAAPSWRPDGTLVTYLALGDAGWSIEMTILSEPRLHRTLVEDEDFFLTPVAWSDRQNMVYAANGKIRLRGFDSWSSDTVPFRVRIGSPAPVAIADRQRRELLTVDVPTGKTVIRAPRLFDGLGTGYRRNRDIVIDGGHIAAIQTPAVHEDAIVFDLGDVTVLPGFIDAYAPLPGDAPTEIGPVLLSLGVTTLVAEAVDGEALTRAWSGKAVPGPRVLAAAAVDALDGPSTPWLVTIGGDRLSGVHHRDNVRAWQSRGVPVLAENWQAALGSGASLLLGAGARPTSPGGRSYQDVQLASGDNAVTLVSGLADASTPGVDSLRNARGAEFLPYSTGLLRRFDQTQDLSAAASTIVLGSQPNGLPAGLSLHAELRALVAAGLTESQALKAAGVNAAGALGLGLDIGRIATGAAADLVIVDGDPLNDIEDALNIIAIVRNGRFFSVSGLVDRSKTAGTVD